MKQKFFFLALVLFVLSSSLKAQNCDPWIKQAYNALYQRNPSAAECNIKNYNNGSWSSLGELIGYIEGYNRTRPGNFIKGDPWIFRGYWELYSRVPSPFELNIYLYNGGSWNSLEQLKGFIKDFQNSLSQNGVKLVPGKLKDKDAAAMVDNSNNLLAVSLVSLDGGQVIAAGGGNVIAAGGGNVIAPGGGNVVAPGGANITISNNTAGLNVSAGYSVQSTGAKRVIKTAGKGAIIIK